MSDCFYDSVGCLICPQQTAKPFVPARVETRAIVGWNAGGNSVATCRDNLHVVLPAGTVPLGVAGVILGLKGSSANPTMPSGVEHGWCFQSLAGAHVARVIERGATKTSAVTRTDDDVFEIRRVKRQVIYLKNNVPVYTSTLASSGVKLLNCCMYASGDAVGGGA